MCSETVRHWKKQIHFLRFSCFVITVNREHRMIPYFITLYTYHVCCSYVTKAFSEVSLYSFSKFVHSTWPFYLNLNIDNQHTHMIIHCLLISAESGPLVNIHNDIPSGQVKLRAGLPG